MLYLDWKDRLLVNMFIPCIEKWQQAVLGHLVLVVEGFISLLKNKAQTHISYVTLSTHIGFDVKSQNRSFNKHC